MLYKQNAHKSLDNLSNVSINTALLLNTSDGAALGSATKMWSDLFLANGGVINFNNGNITLTHSAGLLSLAGGDYKISGTIGIGGASVGAFGLELQGATTALGGAQFTNTGASGGSGGAGFLVGSNDGAAVITGDRLGWIGFLGHDGTGYDTAGLSGGIISHARETWTNTSHAGSLSFYTVSTTATAISERLRINPTGTANFVNALGIGYAAGTAPNASLDVAAADNGTVMRALIAATQANITATDTFVDFRSNTGSEGTIAGTAVAGVIAYNTFTGSHYTNIIDKTGLETNMLLEIIDETPVFQKIISDKTIEYEEVVPSEPKIGDIMPTEKTITKTKFVEYEASPKEQLFKTRISQTKGSKGAIGVYLGTDKEGRDMVGSIGTGFIWVANKGKNIQIGDFLIASDVKGSAEMQADDIYRSNSVAKATQNIIWKAGEMKRLIKCVYLGG